MIANDEQLEQTRKAVRNLEAALMGLKRDVYRLNPARFALMAEPVVDQLRELRQLVDEYVGAAAALREGAAVWLRLVGPRVDWGDTSTRLLSSLLNHVRLGVQAATLI